MCVCLDGAGARATSALTYSPTDLGDRRDALWDFFDPERSALHCEAVAATAGGTAQGRLRDED